MSKTFVISDVHGNYETLLQALQNARIVDANGNRQADRRHKVYSIGDLANCVYDSYDGDLNCLSLVGPIIDGLIIGNHEIPYFDPGNTFAGFYHHADISDRLWELKDAGMIIPCLNVGETLVSHAGYDSRMEVTRGNAREIAAMLGYHWNANNFGYSAFRRIGIERGGPDRIGGIIWQDFKRLESNFPQIVGHTPGKTIRYKPNAICIDTGAKDGVKLPTIIEVS